MFEKPKQMIIYVDGKKVVMPFNCSVYKDKTVKIANRFTGEETEMPGYAAAVYDYTISSNLKAEREDAAEFTGYSQHWSTVRRGLDWFRQHFAKEYMVLLDQI